MRSAGPLPIKLIATSQGLKANAAIALAAGPDVLLAGELSLVPTHDR